jgi:hypothetical protein
LSKKYNPELPATLRTTNAYMLIWTNVSSASLLPSPISTENVSLTALMDSTTLEKDSADLALLNAEHAMELKMEIVLLAF